MLHQFLKDNREALITRCRAKVAKRSAPRPTEVELKFGIPLFLDQLTKTLRLEQSTAASQLHTSANSTKDSGKSESQTEIGESASSHGEELLQKGFTVDQVVHDYGDLCQAVTEMALEENAPITTDEFKTLNGCLDNAIAGAVTGYGRHRDRQKADEGGAVANERLGFLSHELRNLLNTAMLAVEAIKTGNVGVSGATGRVLDRSLSGMRDHIDRSLAEVRLAAGLPEKRERMSVSHFLSEVQVSAVMDARTRGVGLTCTLVSPGLWVDADRHMLSSAISNLLQNACKFTKAGGLVTLSAIGVNDRVLIEIADQCGGLPAGKAEELFRPFEQRSSDRSGLGLGLSISRRGVEANGGELRVRNQPGIGCIFTIDLPRQEPPA